MIDWLRRLAVFLCSVSAFGMACAQVSGSGQVKRFTPEFFGINMARPTSSMAWPDVPFGSWRLWDAHVAWPQLEPAPGRWNWTLLDRYVDEAQRHGVPLLLVLGQSPEWASSRPGERSAYRPGMAAEPKDLLAWTRYVSSVAQRYKGRIREYQVWNEPSDRSHFTGSVAALVDMTCSAYRALKAIDPQITVVGAGSAGVGSHVQYLADFLAAGGSKCIDVVDHHFYVPRHAPEAMTPVIQQVRDIMVRHGVGHLPLWSTEIGWWIENDDASPDHPMVTKGGWRKVAVGDELFSTLARAHVLARDAGVERLYWYAWKNHSWGLSDMSTGRAKRGADLWGRWVTDLINGELLGCRTTGHRVDCSLRLAGGKQVRVWWEDDDRGPREGPALKARSPLARPRMD